MIGPVHPSSNSMVRYIELSGKRSLDHEVMRRKTVDSPDVYKERRDEKAEYHEANSGIKSASNTVVILLWLPNWAVEVVAEQELSGKERVDRNRRHLEDDTGDLRIWLSCVYSCPINLTYHYLCPLFRVTARLRSEASSRASNCLDNQRNKIAENKNNCIFQTTTR